MEETQIVITGFHRSGTSLAAMMLNRGGVFLGEKLLGEKASNLFGHFEDLEFIKLHQRILEENRKTWKVDHEFIPYISQDVITLAESLVEKRNANYPVWGFKDPRSSIFLNFWDSMLSNMKTIILYRHYSSCWRSLLKRHSRDIIVGSGVAERHLGFFNDLELSLRMWIFNNKMLLKFAEKADKESYVFVSNEAIIEGCPLIKLVNKKFSLNLGYEHNVIRQSLINNDRIALDFVSKETRDELESIWDALNKHASLNGAESPEYYSIKESPIDEKELDLAYALKLLEIKATLPLQVSGKRKSKINALEDILADGRDVQQKIEGGGD